MNPAMLFPHLDGRSQLTTEQSAKLRHDAANVQMAQSCHADLTILEADAIRAKVLQIKAEIYGRYYPGRDRVVADPRD